MKRFVACTALLFSVCVTASAAAQDTDYRTEERADGYSVIFHDDPLLAGGFGANDVLLQQGHRPIRNTLIRPRTHFVGELLKSVENL